MLIGAGLTAFYTCRCVWMAFFGEPRGHLHGHDAQPAMKTALAPLALGTLVTWLLAGPFGTLLAETLPFHHLEAEPTGELLLKVITAPATLVALAVVAVGLAAWWQRSALAPIGRALQGLGQAAANSFGFEAINRAIVTAVQSAAEKLRSTQTGLLNWNVFAIIAALVIVLILFYTGA